MVEFSIDKNISIVSFDVFRAVTRKNVVLRDIKPQFVPHGKYFTSPPPSPVG
jgi:hypothetical protein